MAEHSTCISNAIIIYDNVWQFMVIYDNVGQNLTKENIPTDLIYRTNHFPFHLIMIF